MDKVEKTVVEMTQWETDEQLIWHEYGPELYLTVCQTGYVDEFRVLNEEKSKPLIISHSGVDVSTE
tara:strand:+ start:1786 stop:1983 length:198 start_codon:yes stop_codon:yes gene_type:complete